MVCHPAFPKALAASLPEMLASRAAGCGLYLEPAEIWSYRNENFGLLAMWVAGNCLLIVRPQPRGDRFLDVGQSFLFVLSLRNTSGQGRAFDNEPAVFRFIERYVENHIVILSIAIGGYNGQCFHCGLARSGVRVRI